MENPTIGLAFLAGFLSFISPCVLPLVPAYIGYMSGRMTHSLAAQTASGDADAITNRSVVSMRLHMLLHGIAFVLGFTVVFILIGLLTTAFVSVAGNFVSTFTEIIGRVGGVIIIFFGFHFMGVLPKVFNWLRKKQNSAILDNPISSLIIAAIVSVLIHWGFVGEVILVLPLIAAFLLALALSGAFTQPGKFWNRVIDRIELALYSDTRSEMEMSGREGLGGSALMGVVFSAGWTPCIGPLLGTILTIAAQTGEVAQAIPLLAAYSLGLGIPFILTAVLMNNAQGILLRRLLRYVNKIELISGGLLIIIGLLVASGQLQNLSQELTQGDFSDLSFRIEECGIGFFEGELQLGHVGPCMSGTLVPVVLGQSANGTLTASQTQMEFIFHSEEDVTIDVEFSKRSEGFTPLVTLLSPSGTELTQSDTGMTTSNDKYLSIIDFSLPDNGIYTVVIRNIETPGEDKSDTFRIKIREAQAEDLTEAPVVDIIASGTIGDNLDDEGETVLENIAENAVNVGTIEDLAEQSDVEIGLEVGNQAPNFAVISDTGEEIQLSDLRGKIVLLNFWGTWCGPCRREMPEFQEAFEKHGGDNFTIFAVAGNDTFPAIREFREDFGLSFPLALDEDGSIDNLFSIQQRPSSYFINADGIIVARHFGLMVESQIQELLEEALAS